MFNCHKDIKDLLKLVVYFAVMLASTIAIFSAITWIVSLEIKYPEQEINHNNYGEHDATHE